MLDEELYKPSPWGARFHYLRDERGNTIREILGAGSAGPGKTTVLLMDPFEKIIIEHKRCQDTKHKYHLEWGASLGWALHLRRTRTRLEQTIAKSKRIFRAFDPDARWDENKTTWTFSSGYRYQFGHCKDPSDWEQYLSFEFDHIMYDELVEFDQEQYDQINTRLRSSDPILATMLKIRAMSNPLMRRVKGENFTVKNPQWVKDYFVKPAPDGSVLLRKKLTRQDGSTDYHTRCYLRATLYDNPNKEFVKQYELTLLGSKPHIRNALLYGRWDASENSYFDEWNPSLHVIKPFRVPEDWTFYRSMDWGFKVPGCVHWWAMDPDENLYCIRELTFKGKVDTEVAAMIEAIERSLGLWDNKAKRSTITGPADTQLWEQRGDSGKSKYQIFCERGIPWVQADKKSRAANAGHLYKRIADHDNGTKQPGLVVFDTCKKLIETLPAIQGEPGDPDTPQDGGEDHWADSAFYSAAFASKGRKAIPKRKHKPDDWEIEAKREKKSVGTSFGYGMNY